MAKRKQFNIEEMEQHLIDAGLFERKDLTGIAMLLYDRTKYEPKNTLLNNNELMKTLTNTKSKIKHHESDNSKNIEYNIVPFLKAKTFLSKSYKERANILHCYHTLMKRHRETLACKSLVRAPTSKSIPISNNLGSTCKTENKSAETYVSRFGRQTKRKNYMDDDSLEDFVEKNDFNDEEWLTKTAISTSPEIKAKNNSELEVANVDNIDILSTDTQEPAEEASPIDDPHFLNESVSKADHSRPKRPLKHTDKVFNQLKKDYDKRKQEELRMEVFENSLPSLDDNYNIEDSQETADSKSKRQKLNKKGTEDVTLIKNDETKIVNAFKRQKGTVQPLDVTINKTSLKKTENKPWTRGRRKKSTTDDQIPSNSKETNDSVDCPICGNKFNKIEIEEHASSCGDFADQISNIKMCDVCDKILTNEEYHAHISACITSQTEQ